MKIIIALGIILYSNYSYSLANWKLVQKHEKSLEVWKYTVEKNIFVTFDEKKMKGINIKSLTKESLLKKYIQKKSKFLKLIGIANWKVKDNSLNKTRDQFKVSGNYTGHQQNVVYFEELQIFKNKKIKQILFTAPKNTNKIFRIKNQIVPWLLSRKTN